MLRDSRRPDTALLELASVISAVKVVKAIMVRVCASEECKTSARFNHIGEQKGKFCSRHKEPGMVDIVHPHCKIEGCTTLASLNMPGDSRGEFCSQHKLG